MTRREMLARMGSDELAEWRAVARIRPLGLANWVVFEKRVQSQEEILRNIKTLVGACKRGNNRRT